MLHRLSTGSLEVAVRPANPRAPTASDATGTAVPGWPCPSSRGSGREFGAGRGVEKASAGGGAAHRRLEGLARPLAATATCPDAIRGDHTPGATLLRYHRGGSRRGVPRAPRTSRARRAWRWKRGPSPGATGPATAPPERSRDAPWQADAAGRGPPPSPSAPPPGARRPHRAPGPPPPSASP